MPEKRTLENLMKEIEELKAELQERKLSLPAHSIRPHQWLVIEELEDKIHKLEEKVKDLDSRKGTEGGI
jgi:hypothetical protein